MLRLNFITKSEQHLESRPMEQFTKKWNMLNVFFNSPEVGRFYKSVIGHRPLENKKSRKEYIKST